MKKKTNLFIVGATKSGTTSLHNYLSQHPDVFMSANKEPHYFAKNDIKEYKGPGDKYIQNEMFVTEELGYNQLFEKSEDQKVIGESTATYLYYSSAAEEIKRFNPDAKIIILLRDPIQRAFSAYMHMRRDGRESVHSFLETLNLEEKRKKDDWMPIWFYKDLGMYYQQVKKYIDIFGIQNVKVDLFEDVRNDWDKYLESVCAYLGIDKHHRFDTRVSDNISGLPKSRILHNLLRRKNIFTGTVKLLLPENERKLLKACFNKFNIKKSNKLTLNEKLFLGNFYKESNQKLAELLKVDLKRWDS
jgi:hypothetical protein